ncbi:hypothetical protein [Fulvivirga imtechensis]|nr:hypothetical protein [Fulvivirga imtechensis]
MTLPYPVSSWISVVLYLCLFLIFGIGLWQSLNKHLFRKPGLSGHSLVPLGLTALTFGVIGLVKGYMDVLQAADAAGEMTKIQLAHALVHGSLAGAPFPILGLLCLGLSFVFKYINQ